MVATFPLIKYLGSKRTLLPAITGVVNALAPARGRVLDLFSGTSRVGHALKAEGHQVIANDLASYAHILARAYVETDLEDVIHDAERLLAEFARLPGHPGYFTETFCEKSRFFQPKNGARVDAIRDGIAHKHLPPSLEAVLLVSLMEAADRVDSTTGVQMAYLKTWAPRAHHDLALRMPKLLPRAARGPGRALCLDAREAARAHAADIAYLDPPYNQHAYVGNYHVWETLIRWDAPAHYGKACKRADVRDRKSPFNHKRAILPALTEVLAALDARFVVVSFNDEGYVTRNEMETLLATRGEVVTLAFDNKRYVGAQIGIHNPRGERVGKVGRLRNREFLFVCGPGARLALAKAGLAA